MVIPPAVAAVGPVRANHALDSIVLVFVLGDVVGAVDVVGGDIVRTSVKSGGDRPRQISHRISKSPDEAPPRQHWRYGWRRHCR